MKKFPTAVVTHCGVCGSAASSATLRMSVHPSPDERGHCRVRARPNVCSTPNVQFTMVALREVSPDQGRASLGRKQTLRGAVSAGPFFERQRGF